MREPESVRAVMWAAIAIVLAASLAAQLAALRGMGRRRPIGDEGAYLASGDPRDPQDAAGLPPQRFLRPPVLPWLVAACRKGSGSSAAGEGRVRLLLGLASVFTVGLTAVAGLWVGGPALALLAATLLAAQPERILLGCHIWPDSLLALTLAALAVVATLPAASPAAALAAGALCAVGTLTRIDFLVVPPVMLIGWAWSAAPISPAVLAGLLLPTLAALAGLTIRNYRRHGVALPDTTWAFNLTVMAAEARRTGNGRLAFDSVLAGAHAEWMRLDLAEGAGKGAAALRQTLRSPGRLAGGIVRRLLTLAGPDTFVTEKLLPAGAAYPDLGELARRRWVAVLRVAFPALLTAVLLGAAAGRHVPGGASWPSLGLLAVAALFHARTRYRVAAMPALSLLAGEGLLRGVERLAARPWEAIPLVLLAALLFWALLRIDCSAELPLENR